MAVHALHLSDFRNHVSLSIRAGDGLVAIVGENGAGKTNILEALSLLTPGRGLRGAALSDMACSAGEGGFTLSATLSDAAGGAQIGTGTRLPAPERRIVRINGANASANALAEWLSVLWLTPAMDRLFAGTAGERRRFLDRLTLALYPTHAGNATRYETAMRERNRLLAEEKPFDPQWLAALEAQMAEYGHAIAQARVTLVEALQSALAHLPDSPFARPVLALEGWDGQQDLTQLLAANRHRDKAAGRAVEGPHRTDLVVHHAAKGQTAARCSTGEQKALLISIILAHGDLVAERIGRRPLLLLDEVAAHLDPLRRQALFERLAASGGQVWMTGTEAELFSEMPDGCTMLLLEAGQIKPATCLPPAASVQR